MNASSQPESRSSSSAHTTPAQNTRTQEEGSRFTSRNSSQQNTTEADKRKNVYKLLQTTSKTIQDATPLAINKETRELLFAASRYIRLAAVAFRSNYFDKTAELCNKALETIENLRAAHIKSKKIIEEYTALHIKAKRLHTQLHVSSLSGELYHKIQNARILLNYAEQFFGNEIYAKAIEYAKRSLTILESVSTVSPPASTPSESDNSFQQRTLKELDRCRVLIWRTEQNMVTGEIRRDFLKAKGFFLKASHFVKTARYSESMEELKKAFEILDNIPARMQDYHNKKLTAQNALKKANERFEIIRRKQLTGEDLSNFIKARKLLYSARDFFDRALFDEARQHSEQSYDILKLL